MTKYEKLTDEADANQIIVKELDIARYDGFILDNHIAIRYSIPTESEKACVLAEELGHYYTTVGDILDQSIVMNRKQEYRARLWGYNRMIGLVGIVAAYRAKCTNRYEVAEFLDVPEKYLAEALKVYESKYGTGIVCGDEWVMFTPYIDILDYATLKQYIQKQKQCKNIH